MEEIENDERERAKWVAGGGEFTDTQPTFIRPQHLQADTEHTERTL